MKNFLIAVLFVLSINMFAQSGDNAIGKFALSVEPLGFVQFGPLVNAEIGLTDNLVLNAHVRFATAGLLMKIAFRDEVPDKVENIAFGGGLKYFFGDNKNKPYIGVMGEFGKRTFVDDQGEPYETENTMNHFDFIMNGGYRFRSASGFYLTTGAYVGAEFTNNDITSFTDPGYYTSERTIENENGIYPFFMLEIGIGIEF